MTQPTIEEAVIRARKCVDTQRPLAWCAVAVLLRTIGALQEEIRRLERRRVAGESKT